MKKQTFAVIGLGRFGSAMALTLTELKPEVRPANAGAAAIAKSVDAEAARIAAAIPKGAFTVVLDETGKLVTPTISPRNSRSGGAQAATSRSSSVVPMALQRH